MTEGKTVLLVKGAGRVRRPAVCVFLGASRSGEPRRLRTHHDPYYHKILWLMAVRSQI